MSELDRRTFKCPRCHRPILSRKGECIFCLLRFDDDTLFSCPSCGALVGQEDQRCPGCGAPLSASGIGPGTMTEAESDELLAEIERMSREIAEKIESGMEGISPEEKARVDRLVQRMLELQVTGAGEMGIREAEPKAVEEAGRPAATRVRETPGRVNGLRGAERGAPRRDKDWMRRPVARRLALWQLVAVIVAVAVMLSSLVLVIQMAEPLEGIAIDGDFSDWKDVPAYSFSSQLPGLLPGVDEARLSLLDAGTAAIYLKLGSGMFATPSPSAIYIFADTDGDAATGYVLSSQLGADQLVLLVGWDGQVRSSSVNQFTGTEDRANWSAWSPSVGLRIARAGAELELSWPLGQATDDELVRVVLVSVMDGEEHRGVTMSQAGTMVARQTPLVVDHVVTFPTPTLMTAEFILMGAGEGESYTVHPRAVGSLDDEATASPLQVSAAAWEESQLSADISSLSPGDSFWYALAPTVDEFSGAVEVIGPAPKGYYMSPPSMIVIDGVFGDWSEIALSDTDPEPLSNPDIDINEFGAATQDDSHFFYVGVEGVALGGAAVPEQRSKTAPEGPPSVVRLRKTGEDLMQTFIDRDPGSLTGRMIRAGEELIWADLLIEVFGRDGTVTDTAVKEWDGASNSWSTIGQVDEIAVRDGGIELSVPKALLGDDLAAAEIVYFMTDWRKVSDHSKLGGALADPWAITSTGLDYRSPDGVTWSQHSSITLDPDERIVDLTTNPSKDRVFAITNTGCAYRWVVDSSGQWSSKLTSAIPGTDDVVALAVLTDVWDVGFSLTADGKLYYKTSFNPLNPGSWTYVSRITGGYTDLVDLAWRAGQTTGTAELYALRSASDSSLFLTTDGGSSWSAVGSSTGSTQEQVQMAVLPGAAYELFVLGGSGELRYSPDSGASWSSVGDLPDPGTGGGYIGIAIDPQSNILVMRESGECYRSTDNGASFSYTGRADSDDIVGFTAPIPEFMSLALPVLATVMIVLLLSRPRLRGREPSSEEDP